MNNNLKYDLKILYPKSFQNVVDVSYAKSRLPARNDGLSGSAWVGYGVERIPYYTQIPRYPAGNYYSVGSIKGAKASGLSGYAKYRGLADYSSSTIANFINLILREQKARIGRFLTYDKLLANLKDRAYTIRKVNPSVGTALEGRVNNAIANQKRLESEGFEIINAVGQIQKNPIVQLLMKETVDRSVISDDVFARGSDLIALLKNLTTRSASLNSALGDHEAVISRLEKDIESMEGDLAERGLLRKTVKIGSETIGKALKYALIPAGIIGVLYLMPKTRKR